MDKENRQKISFQISKVLLWKFNEEIRKLPLARDQFLNCLIKSEVEILAEELKGKKLSDESKKYIAANLKHLHTGTQPVSVLVCTEVADRLNEVVKETNIVRDAFINRIIYFFLMTDKLRAKLRLGNTIAYEAEALNWEEYPLSPIRWIEEILASPLIHLRYELKKNFGSMYLFPMPERFVGLTCFAENSEVPGTDEYKLIMEELANSI